jgi:hypothetical protein
MPLWCCCDAECVYDWEFPLFFLLASSFFLSLFLCLWLEFYSKFVVLFCLPLEFQLALFSFLFLLVYSFSLSITPTRTHTYYSPTHPTHSPNLLNPLTQPTPSPTCTVPRGHRGQGRGRAARKTRQTNQRAVARFGADAIAAGGRRRGTRLVAGLV